MKQLRTGVFQIVGILALSTLPIAAGDATGAAIAKVVLDASGIKTGLCLHLGCGRADAPGLTAALAESSVMLVHGLAFDDAALDRARAGIEARGVNGRAMVEKWNEKSLPYLSDMAELIVIEDMAALTAQGIPREEIQRVAAPGGMVCVLDGGKWTSTAKPRPKVMDEWTHPHHGPDENMVSSDKALCFPISLRWIDGVPSGRGGFGECASTRAVILAGGRCFTVSLEDLGNQPAQKQSAWLTARDAYSGFPLWKLSCDADYGKVELDWRNVWPIVASDRRVYTRHANELIVVDAATGKVETTCATKYQPRRLLLLSGCLVAACWEKMELSNPKDGFENDSIRAVWWPGGAGTVEAFDAETGKPKWSLPLNALTIAASDGVLYALTSKGNPPTERELVAIELATGKEKWRVPHTAFGEDPDTCLNFAGSGCAVISKTKTKGKPAVSVVSASDGKILFSIPGTTARCIVDGELWCTDVRYDLKTGKKMPGSGVGATYAGSNVIGGCIPPIVVGDRLITGARSGGFLQLPESPDKKPVNLSYSGARGACLQGMVPANGMFYTAQNNCACNGGQVGGFLAIGPCGETPKTEDFEKPRLIEKGPAFGAVEALPSTDDWPMYRQNAERSGGISATVPDTLKELWKVQCVKPGDGEFGEAWNARIGAPQPLTAPIVAAGMVIVAGFDSGQIIALNPATGAIVWRKSLGSRVDSPPAYEKGLLLVGCHDGWAYALRAKDGAQAYRVRIAPRERRMVAHGLVESVWPATGAVLVHNGTAYATAGRSTKTDGGIALVAFKPENGETVWAKCMGDDQTCLIDVLSIQSGELVWHWMRMDPKTGSFLAPAQKFMQHGGMLDGCWTAGFSKGGGRGFMLGKACSSMMAWNDQLVVWPAVAVSRSKVEAPKPPATAAPKHPDAFKAEEMAWHTELEPHIEWARVYAMALTGNSTFFAGSVYNGWANGKYDGSFLWIKATATGKTQQAAIKLESPPSYDSLAVAGGRVYLCLQSGEIICWGK